MGKSITIRTKGVVRKPCAYSMYKVELYNEKGKLTGNEVLVTVSNRLTREVDDLQVGDIVIVELCTSYKDKGRVLEMAG